jgi:hypothetical protein
MRDSHFDVQSFCSSVDSILNRYREKDSEVLSRITPSAFRNFTNEFRILDKSEENLVRIALLSWYVPEEIGVCLRMSLEENIGPEVDWIRLLLFSKAESILFLQETRKWHTRDFFGNILNTEKMIQCLFTIRPIYSPTHAVKRPQRHRGYRDKGTLRLQHEIHQDWSATDEQNQIERHREIAHYTLLFARGWIQ